MQDSKYDSKCINEKLSTTIRNFGSLWKPNFLNFRLSIASRARWSSIRRRRRVKTQAVFNDSPFSLKQPSFSVSGRRENSPCLLLVVSGIRLPPTRGRLSRVRFSRATRRLEPTSALRPPKPQHPLTLAFCTLSPATSLLTVQEMFILAFYGLLRRIFGFRCPPLSESQRPFRASRLETLNRTVLFHFFRCLRAWILSTVFSPLSSTDHFSFNRRG